MSVIFTYISYLYEVYLLYDQNFLKSQFLFNFYAEYPEENVYFYFANWFAIHCYFLFVYSLSRLLSYSHLCGA